MLTQNSKGQVYYGLHFYPGVAEYAEAGKDPYRVFLNEDTLREMDPTFAGRPVFVRHVDEVDQNLIELKKEADGWVSESFFNSVDGKHWVKFIAVSEKAFNAIKQGWRLSNCYVPKTFSQGGLWNGVSYAKEVTGGEYEHLAIVPDPRYDESVIMTPEEFKRYNEEKAIELKRLSNSKGDEKMKLKFFKREKVENALDENMMVQLPKSLKEVSILQVVNEADEAEMKKPKDGEKMMANGEHHVAVGEKMMTVNELVAKHMAMCDALEAGKGTEGGDDSEVDPAMANAEDDEEKKKKENEKKEEDEKKKNALELKKKEDKVKADKLRNAHLTPPAAPIVIAQTLQDRVDIGKARYGSK